jgi:uncharacterized protein (DUF2126 family)
VNAYEAEARRLARFMTQGHQHGSYDPPPLKPNPDLPFTLDLRHG